MNIKVAAEAIRINNFEEIESGLRIYSASRLISGDTTVAMVASEDTDYILAVGSGPLFDELTGERTDDYLLAPLSHENRLVLNRHLGYTNPVCCGREGVSIGLGDRLGIAAEGHVRAIAGRTVIPVFAQQSKRELDLTQRSFKSVLDDAVFGIIRAGYRGPFGADADHLKDPKDIAEAINLGYSMITLDCSDFIEKQKENMTEKEVKKAIKKLPSETTAYYINKYSDKSFSIENVDIFFPGEELKIHILTYHKAIKFMMQIYRQYIELAPREMDFEISIDETETPTSPAAHYLIGRELEDAVVRATSIAPRFCGEFQKGIDYRGNIKQFKEELKTHAAIADHFGYRLSIHSGSDKFSIFPHVGAVTKKRFHLKTAGTSWLEALRVIAANEPELYRILHTFARDNFPKALKYYHVSADLASVAPLEETDDKDLPRYLDEDDARQMLHITYGLILQETDRSKKKYMRDGLYAALKKHRRDYRDNLHNHIGKHLRDLGLLDV